jgi:gas vesicle protein GvpA/GvpJ/GvpM family
VTGATDGRVDVTGATGGRGAADCDIAVRYPQQQVALVDLLDRVLAGGVVIAGDVTLSIADVPLVHVSLRALVMSVRAEMCAAPPVRAAS